MLFSRITGYPGAARDVMLLLHPVFYRFQYYLFIDRFFMFNACLIDGIFANVVAAACKRVFFYPTFYIYMYTLPQQIITHMVCHLKLLRIIKATFIA